MNALPSETANRAVARRTSSTRSLLPLTIRRNAARSALVMRRNGSRCGVGMGSSFLAHYPAKTPAPAIWGMTH
jgi:hypothetical protein